MNLRVVVNRKFKNNNSSSKHLVNWHEAASCAVQIELRDYDIFNETFVTQIIVTQLLPPEENLYLRCLTNNLTDVSLASRLADDCSMHWGQDIYTRYVHQLTTAHNKTKGANPMICEGLFNLFGTSSEEIVNHTQNFLQSGTRIK